MMIIIYALIIALNIADYITTRIILKCGGQELNPIIKCFIDKGLFIHAKILLTGIIVLGLYFLNANYPIIALLIGCAIVIAFVWAVVHNIQQIRIMRGQGGARWII